MKGRAGSSQERGKERYRRAGLTALGSAASTGVTIVVSFIITPLTFSYLGSSRFGVWATLGASVAVLQLADIGIGNGLLNLAAASRASGDENRVAQQLSSAVALTFAVGLLLCGAFLVLYPSVDWAAALNTGEEARSEVGPAVLTLVLVTLLGMPASLVAKMQSAFQEGYFSEAWKIVGSLLRLGGVVTCVLLRTTIAWLVFATLIGPIVANVANAIHLFSRRRPALKPAFRLIDRVTASSVIRAGGWFFVLQASAAISYSTDNIVIARVLGAEVVPRYSIPASLFAVITLASGFLLTPLWPAYREAVQTGDLEWVSTTLRRSTGWGLLAAASASGLLVLAGPYIVRIWVGDGVPVELSVLLGLAAWAVIDTTWRAISVFLNALGPVRVLAGSATVMAAFNVGLSVVLTRSIGVAGAIWGTVLSYLLMMGIILCVLMPGLVKGIRDGTLSLHKIA